MPNFDNWQHEIIAALTGIGAALGWGRILDYLSERKQQKIAARDKEEAEEHEQRRQYQDQIHEDWKYLREQLQRAEESYRVAEAEKFQLQNEVVILREKLQILQLQLDLKKD